MADSTTTAQSKKNSYFSRKSSNKIRKPINIQAQKLQNYFTPS